MDSVHRPMRNFLQALIRRASPAAPPGVVAAPPGVRLYAVGDVHGSLGPFADIVDQIRVDAAEARTFGLTPIAIFLGDYVDRGADSRTVVDRLATDPLPGIETQFLLGNHEAAMLDFLTAPERGEAWLTYGGMETLLSYGVRVRGEGRPRLADLSAQLVEKLPARHKSFLEALRPMATFGDYAFVHAGVLPGVALEAQRVEDLIAIREEFLEARGWHGKMVVHGHSIVEAPEFRSNRIAIDTGAYFTGVLTCLVMEEDRVRVLSTSPSSLSASSAASGGVRGAKVTHSFERNF